VKPTNTPVQQPSEALKIYGHLDQIDDNLTVTGWALCIPRTGPAKVEIYVDELLAAEGLANRPRPDLAALGAGRIMSGFSIALPENSIKNVKSKITAKLSGHALAGSLVLDLGPHLEINILGIIKNHLSVELRGWPGNKLDAEIFVDCTPLSNVTFNRASDAPKEPLLAKLTLPQRLIDGQPHVYVCQAKHGDLLVNSNATAITYPEYQVHIDKAETSSIVGWAFRTDSLDPLKLDLVPSNKIGVTFQREIFLERRDVAGSFPNAPINSGFQFHVNAKAGCAAEYDLIDKETDIRIAIVSIANAYEALTKTAEFLASCENETARTVLKSMLSKTINNNDGKVVSSVTLQPAPVRPVRQPKPEISVIIPVYGGAPETVACIESVLASKNEASSRIIIINDCSPDPLIAHYLRSLEQRNVENLSIVHQKNNAGFSASVNLGMIISGGNDVILLNADTVVHNNWLDRLISAAASDSRIGTVTPLSNNAEICSFPYLCKSLPVDSIELAEEIDKIAADANKGQLIDIPVAIGFCMYIKRQCIDEIGLFDAATWGRGYGEEVDFCLKASSQGWRHVAAGDIFVVHRGSVSFGDEKLERIKESAKKISEIYPFYDSAIQRFLSADPLQSLRRRLSIELIAKFLPHERILHVTHSFGGGTEQYIKDITEINAQDCQTPIVLRFSSNGSATLTIDLRNTKISGLFSTQHVEDFSAAESEAIKYCLIKLSFQRMHIHSPFGIQPTLLTWLTNSYQYTMTIHDYSWICPRVQLQTGGRYCEEPAIEQCNRCVSFHGAHPGLSQFISQEKVDVSEYREKFSEVILRAETVFAGAKDVANRLGRYNPQANYIIQPHPKPESSIFARTKKFRRHYIPNGKIKIALLGAISEIKGFSTLINCAKYANENNLPIEFIVIGHTQNDEACRAQPNITVSGRYKDDDLDSLVERYQPHFFLFPNQCPETFSYTLSHSFRLGIWPIVSDIGAPAERVGENKFGSVYPTSFGAREICAYILDLAIRQYS